jgi:cell volume regulation protein A
VSDVQPFAEVVLLVAVVGLVAVLSNRLTPFVKIPSAGLFFAGAAIAVHVIPDLHAPHERTVTRLVTVALLLILFDGGMHLGRRRFDAARWPILALGVVGTFLTVGGTALVTELVVGAGWFAAVLVATAIAPTDPAVVFSVLGPREVAGRSGIILEGESGVNDPVGIALMASLLTAGTVDAGAMAHVAGEFLLEMLVGGVFGALGALGLIWFMRRIPLPGEGLYLLRTLACVLLLYGATTLAHGSGFLAVFLAGILIGDEKAPYKAEIKRFHSALASLAEIVAFVALGLTVDLSVLGQSGVWVPGLVLGVVLAVVVRPVLAGLCLLPARLGREESAFILFAGLKGAVPILLGTYIITSDVADAPRLFGIVVIVVAFSVAVQGSLVPTVARRLHLRMRMIEPEPWSYGVRLVQEPEGIHRVTVRRGAPADGCTIEGLADLPEDAWISLVVRDRQLLGVRGDTLLRAGDEVMVLAPPERAEAVRSAFEPRPGVGP